MLRRVGVLTAPFTLTGSPGATRVPVTSPWEAILATDREASPDGSPAPRPMSSVVGLTPMLWKPTSCHTPFSIFSTTPLELTLAIAASVDSAPLWQLAQPP